MKYHSILSSIVLHPFKKKFNLLRSHVISSFWVLTLFLSLLFMSTLFQELFRSLVLLQFPCSPLWFSSDVLLVGKEGYSGTFSFLVSCIKRQVFSQNNNPFFIEKLLDGCRFKSDGRFSSVSSKSPFRRGFPSSTLTLVNFTFPHLWRKPSEGGKKREKKDGVGRPRSPGGDSLM